MLHQTFRRRLHSLSSVVNRVGSSRSSLLESNRSEWHSTTILCVKKNDRVTMIGDGQVSLGHMVVKPNARKIRRIGKDILVGMAGSTADAMTLIDRLEKKLEEHSHQLKRACVELAKDWRMDKYLRRLEAVLIVADKEVMLELTGTGDVLEPYGNALGIGSGGFYALAAARALMDTDLTSEEICKKSMVIAADICIYTNHNTIMESIQIDAKAIETACPEISPKIN